MSRMAVARCVARSKRVSVSRRPYVEPTTGWPTTRIATSSPCARRGTASTLWSSLSSRTIAGRSEEHTSELQSRLHLVCRLLLEKKNQHSLFPSFLHITSHLTPEHQTFHRGLPSVSVW